MHIHSCGHKCKRATRRWEYFKHWNWEGRVIAVPRSQMWQQKVNLCFGRRALSRGRWQEIWEIMQISFRLHFQMTDRLPNWQLACVGLSLARAVTVWWQVEWISPPGSQAFNHIPLFVSVPLCVCLSPPSSPFSVFLHLLSLPRLCHSLSVFLFFLHPRLTPSQMSWKQVKQIKFRDKSYTLKQFTECILS